MTPPGIASASLALALALALTGVGCGGGERLTVSAASSLTDAFRAYGSATVAEERFSFGGSDEGAAQIRAGAPVDVFAAASPRITAGLAAEGLLEAPVPLARNELVLAVPRGSTLLDPPISLRDGPLRLADAGEIALAIGADGLPVGDYTRAVLGRLSPPKRNAILGMVRTEEPEVKGIVAKLVAGVADAGFVYRTDVVAAGESLVGIALPARLEPQTELSIGVVTESDRPEAAAAFVEGLTDGQGREALLAAGFELP